MGKLADRGQSISDRVEAINGRLKTGKQNLYLLQAEINRFMTKLNAERKVQEAASLQTGPDGKKLKPIYTVPTSLQLQLNTLQNKKLKESFASKRTALKLLVTDAKNLKGIVDREFDFEKPPAFEPVSPGTYLNSWNDKADAATAHIA